MNLYLRLLVTWLLARWWKPPIRLGDTIEMKMRVWPNDVDVNGHMNSGRTMTVTDLAMIEYVTRAGFLAVCLRNGWRPLMGGAIISFRHSLLPLRRFTLRMTMTCWDDRWSYMHFEFLQGGRTTAAGYLKGAIVGRKGIVHNDEARTAHGSELVSPAFPASVTAWVEADRGVRQEVDRKPFAPAEGVLQRGAPESSS